MEIETAFYQILKNNAPLTALNAARVFSGQVPQKWDGDTAIALRPSPDKNREIIRTLEGGCTLVNEWFIVFSVTKGAQGATYPFTLCNRLDRAVIAALDEFTGTVIDPATSPTESIEVQEIITTDNTHLYGYDEKTKTHQFISEFRVSYTDVSRIVLQNP